jgi:hypothetical protein
MSFFSFFGGFALWGIVLWVGIYLAFIVADNFPTIFGFSGSKNLATSYLQVTGIVLQQFWSFIQAFFTVMQRLLAMAPRAFQIFVFIVFALFGIGLLANWFLAFNVVCADKIVYESDSFVDVWVAKSLDVGPANVIKNVNYSNSRFYNLGADKVATNLTKEEDLTKEEGSSNFLTIFVPKNGYRSAYINARKGAFKEVTFSQKDSQNFVGYSCSKANDVEIRIFGLKDVLSAQTLLILIAVGLIFQLMAFLGIFR